MVQLFYGKALSAREYSPKCRDGTMAWHTFTAKPVTQQGQVIGLEGFLIDISARKQAEDALKKSKLQFRILFEKMMNGFALHEIISNEAGEPVDDMFLEANAAFEQLTGLKRENIIGKKVTEVLPGIDQDPANWVRRYGRVAATGREARFEQHSRPLGKWFSVLAFSPRKGQFATIFEDVSDRKQAEEALRKSEAEYRSMMEAMTDPVYICSPDLTVQYMNPAMIRRTGRDAVGEPCYRALHNLDEKCRWCVFDKIVAGKSFENNIISPKDHRHYRVTNMPIQNQDGSISKMTIYRDITEYIRSVEEKQKVKEQLMQSQKMESIGNLAGGIVHDFNNILSSILGYAELALDDVEKDISLEDCLKEIYTAGNCAKDLIQQILTFARQSDDQLKPVRVAAIAREVLKLIRSTIPSTIEIRR